MLRLAVPPRHARVEAEAAGGAAPAPRRSPAPGRGRVGALPARARRCSTRCAGGRAAHAVWQALPGEDWAAAAGRGRRGHRRGRAGRAARGARPARRRRACTPPAPPLLGPDAVVALTAELGPGRALPALARGAPRRGAAWSSAPGRPRSRRSSGSGCSPSGTTATTCTPSRARPTRTSATCWCCARTRPAPRCWSAGSRAPRRRSCWSSPGGRARWWPSGPRVRAAMPRVTAIGETDAQLARDPDGPRRPAAGRRVRGGPGRARRGPAGARAGAARRATCRGCRAGRAGRPRAAGTARARWALPGRRPDAGGRTAAAPALPHCRWCGRAEAAFRCAALRVAPAAGRASSGPGAPPRSWAAPSPASPVRALGRRGAGARGGRRPSPSWWWPPRAPSRAPAGGYGAALLLDGWALLSRPDLRVVEETLRRWLGAAALVVPHARRRAGWW